MQRDTVTVERFYTDQADALGLKLVAGANGLKRIIREPTVNRPGLVMSGFTRYFANKRVQVIGNTTLLDQTIAPPDAHSFNPAVLQHYHLPSSRTAR